jgi:hypothetical protein
MPCLSAFIVHLCLAVPQSGDSVESQLASLRADLAALSQAQAGQILDAERASEVRAAVRDALADSATRASLQSGGATVGFDRGFVVTSADGNFSMRVGVLEQVRFVWEFDTDADMGFENRRTQMDLGGHMFDPSLTYRVVFNYSPYTTP